MSRYINADTLIKAIPDTRVDMFENCRNCSTLLRDEVIEIIDAQPTADVWEVMNSAWIPVSERLPDIDMSFPHSDTYLVCYDFDGVGLENYSNMSLFDSRFIVEPRWMNDRYCKVIAWMPLPKPFKPYRGDA